MVTNDLTEALYSQSPEYSENCEKQAELKSKVSQERDMYYKQKRDLLLLDLSSSQKLQLELASEKGASSWLTALPIQKLGFTLNKQQFSDAMSLRYNIEIKNAPRLCVCGDAISVDHLLICKCGRYVSLRHDSLRNLFAEILALAGCKDIVVEPHLQPIKGTQLPKGSSKENGARLVDWMLALEFCGIR